VFTSLHVALYDGLEYAVQIRICPQVKFKSELALVLYVQLTEYSVLLNQL